MIHKTHASNLREGALTDQREATPTQPAPAFRRDSQASRQSYQLVAVELPSVERICASVPHVSHELSLQISRGGMMASGGCLGPHAERIPHELLAEMLEDLLGLAYAQVLAIAIAWGSSKG